MPGRGPQTFKKRQKEQQRKEKQQEKFEKRLARKRDGGAAAEPGQETDVPLTGHDVQTETPEAAADVD